MNIQQQILRLLADGKLYSGRSLAERIGVSRTAVWKHIGQLRELGLEFDAVPGAGYRWLTPVELLQLDRIMAELSADVCGNLEAIDLLWTAESTSDELLAKDPPPQGRSRACLAECQTGGRGRRGRKWLSPFGGGIYLSQSWCFAAAPKELTALPLAAGVAVLRALQAIGTASLSLKWPNDVLADGRKLAGILVDLRGEAEGPLTAVIGVGVNLEVPAPVAAMIQAEGGMPPVGLGQIDTGLARSRNRLAAELISALHQAVREFGQTGFSGFAGEWAARDYLRDRRISVRVGDRVCEGVAKGIAADGQFRLESNGTVERIVSGDVTLRDTQ